MQSCDPHAQSTNRVGSPLQPLSSSKANIGVKMQSPYPDRVAQQSDDTSTSKEQAQFGQPSPLRNPLFDTNAALYNPLRGPPKKKHSDRNARTFRDRLSPTAASAAIPSTANASTSVTDNTNEWQDPAFRAAVTNLQSEMHRPQKTVIAIPRNMATTSTLPPPRPMFSSQSFGGTTKTAPDNPTAANQTAASLVITPSAGEDDDEGNDYDPTVALQTSQNVFGAPDPHMYVDADRANENIKHLMEGAFDEAADEPRIPLRRRQARRKSFGESASTKNLADKLSALDIAQPVPRPADAEDDEDGTVEGLAVRLLPHQVEGVSWMIEKESGKKKDGIVPRGGILADDMGLGKTVQSVALILLNPRPPLDAQKEHPKQRLPKENVGRNTLIVAPLALIRQWESEIKSKIKKSHALKVHVHHGTSRTKSAALLKQHDVVITTYQILASEHATSDLSQPNGARTGCFGVYWYRIILDEAHSIKNRNAKSTLACSALDSWHRWCLTGTPMQNNLDELQSLIRFLRIKPYCELSEWKRHITQPMKSGRGGLAMARLHHFLKVIMKRRTKDILKKDGALNFGGKSADATDSNGGMKIVKREIVNVDCAFSPPEQLFYEQLADRAQKRLDDMLIDGGKADYIGALVLLLRLRQACNHPALIDMASSKSGLDIKDLEIATPKPARTTETEVDALADLFGSVTVSRRVCDICGLKLDASTTPESQAICGECEKSMGLLTTRAEAGESGYQHISRRKQRVLEDSDDDEASDEPSTPKSKIAKKPLNSHLQPSTKINHILTILREESPEHKTIIFSQFTSMLDLIQPHLEQRYVRYDGSMRPDEREASLNALRNNPKTRVLLCSLKCGSLGLNLTAASRVVIVEPFWNPFVEEQAIDRVHRLNQTVDVKVYRLTVGGTVEERIVALQERKRELSKAALEGGKAVGKLSMEDVLNLFKSDSQSAEVIRANAEFAQKFGNDARLIDGPSSSPRKDIQTQHVQGSASTQHLPAKAVRSEHQIYGRRW